MKKLDFLKLAVQNKKYTTKKWIVSAFTIVDNTGTDVSKLTAYDLVYTGISYAYIDPHGEQITIEDSTKNEPLFYFLEPITVNNEWCPNADKEISTTMGNLLFNLISIVPSFGNNIEFQTGKISIGAIEDRIAPILKSDPPDTSKRDGTGIYVSDYINFVNSLQFISGLASISVVSATVKNIQMAPGLDAYKEKLLKEYGTDIDDTNTFIKFEKQLQDYDDEYLKGDPSLRSFMSGKVKNISRKKLFLTVGKERTFAKEKDSIAVINSLHQGWPKEPKQFSELMNITRAGSFSRGAETIKGGVSAKILLRTISNFKIVPGDCNTKMGMKRQYNGTNIDNLVNRYILKEGKSSLVTTKEEADAYVGKDIVVRSPMYCKVAGDNICEICAGKRLSSNPTGLAIPVTEISDIFLTTFMKAMHGKVMSTSKMDLNEVFS